MPARWWRIIVPLIIIGISLSAAVLAAQAIHNRLVFGTFSTQGPPPRIDYCGRRYYPDARFPNAPEESGSAVAAELAANGQVGLSRVGTTPSGMPIVANVMNPAQRAYFHTNVCTMVVWVEASRDRYLPYGLSGGP
jgi:hypothetical protein